MIQYDSILKLTIRNSSKLIVDPRNLIKTFPNLRALLILRGKLITIITSFPADAKIREIRINETKLDTLPDDVFKYLSLSHTIDLRNNALTKINPQSFNITSLNKLYLAGNPWKCNYNMSWILNINNYSLAVKIEDKEKLHCTSPYEGRPLFAVVEIIATLRNECKQTICDCELIHVVVPRNYHQQIHNKRQLMAFVAVNCSYRGLEEMPDFIPKNTTRLYLTGNKISDLTKIITNPIYKEVRDLYLDNNLIESITILDGSYWLEHFRVFSLRGNKLADLPTYALENVLVQGENAVSIYLGNNPWTCDCLFTPGFQDLLLRYTNIIKDIHDIKCNLLMNDGENSRKLIKDLTRTEICVMPNDNEFFLHPLDILNIILATAILLIIGKFIYDYWLFKRTGKLPWIVTKIP
ncbi:hypothetical protein PV328_008933 [Microctonus aethiopoides]|uniref:Protein singed wings 2 n=1 Tax=Microctonus aethiopoides TaxID=144406 RepID=A0AA39FKB0_9HYME|nr:hypothetical protein PV328_008933 [Microctonus aethiopoides]